MPLIVRLSFAIAFIAGLLQGQEGSRLALVVEPGFLTVASASAPEGASPLTAFYVRALVLSGQDSSRWRGNWARVQRHLDSVAQALGMPCAQCLRWNSVRHPARAALQWLA